MPTLSPHGHLIAYDDLDPRDGRPTLLIHGFASNRAEGWRRTGWYSALERRGARAVALDLRGHGESARPHDPADYGRARLAADVVGLMDALELRGVDLIGYSMGAGVALATTLAAPERVRHLVLGGVGARLLNPGERRGAMAAAMLAEDPDTIAPPMLRSFRLFADEQGEDRRALAACAEGEDAPFDPADFAALPPTLVVAGARDGLAGDPQPLADAIPGARAVTLPGCDHFSAIPHALFKAAVFDFLDGWLE